MNQITGVVLEIYQGTVSKGRSAGKPFWTITLVGGKQLSTFTQQYVQGLEQGKEYTFTTEVKGEYENISGVPVPVIQIKEELEKTYDMVAESQTLPNVTSSPESERTYKNRISALQAAVTYVCAMLGGTAGEKDVVEKAKEFEGYIKNG